MGKNHNKSSTNEKDHLSRIKMERQRSNSVSSEIRSKCFKINVLNLL